MANAGTMHDAFVEELRDTYDAEKQLVKALPRMAKAASSADLQTAFETHLEETRGHVDRLDGRETDDPGGGRHQPGSGRKRTSRGGGGGAAGARRTRRIGNGSGKTVSTALTAPEGRRIPTRW
jgi:hypothetical protein